MYSLLLVDDERLELETLRDYIAWEKLGFDRVYTARSGRDAYDKVLRLKPDVMITDIHLSLIHISMGACDYIKKPFVRGELQSRVNAHLMIKYQKDELNRQNQELRTNMEKLNYMAFRDGLTGLYNRRYVVGDLADDIRGHEKQEKKNVLILADIDDFKKINDTYGHDAGDLALVCIATVSYTHLDFRIPGELITGISIIDGND